MVTCVLQRYWKCFCRQEPHDWFLIETRRGRKISALIGFSVVGYPQSSVHNHRFCNLQRARDKLFSWEGLFKCLLKSITERFNYWIQRFFVFKRGADWCFCSKQIWNVLFFSQPGIKVFVLVHQLQVLVLCFFDLGILSLLRRVWFFGLLLEFACWDGSAKEFNLFALKLPLFLCHFQFCSTNAFRDCPDVPGMISSNIGCNPNIIHVLSI